MALCRPTQEGVIFPCDGILPQKYDCGPRLKSRLLVGFGWVDSIEMGTEQSMSRGKQYSYIASPSSSTTADGPFLT
jgi:hypothetical protein